MEAEEGTGELVIKTNGGDARWPVAPFLERLRLRLGWR